MEEGKKLRTNEDSEKTWAKGNTCKEQYISKTLDFLILLLQKNILQSSYLVSANFSISSQL